MRKIIMASITAVVVIAVLAGTLIPVLDDATATTDTFTNIGYDRFTSLSSTDEDELTIIWDHSNPNALNVNGTDIDLIGVSSGWESVIFGQTFTVRYVVTSSDTKLTYNGSSNAKYISLVASGSTDLTVTASAGTATITDGTNTYTETYTDLYYPSLTGDYIMKSMDESAYILTESQVIIANGITTINSSGVGVYITGEFDDYTISFYRGSDITASDVTSVYTTDSDHDSLVKLEKITFNATVDDTTTAVTYSYFLVPYEVTADRVVQFTTGEIAIFDAIPVIVIVALLLGVIAIVLRSRMD